MFKGDDIMKRIICIFLLIIIIISACVMNVSAIPAMHYYGDVNLDRNVDILDATEIQRCLAKITEFSQLSKDLADVDADGHPTVADATMIQRKVAQLIYGFNQKSPGISADVSIANISANFNSGKAMVGVAVTFDTVAYSVEGVPLTYEYYIDNALVTNEKSENSQFTYVFEESGPHTVSVKVYNKYGENEERSIKYDVIDKGIDDSLMVSGIHANSLHLSPMNDIVITAHAYGGVAPYEYRFEQKDMGIIQDYSNYNRLDLGVLRLGTWVVKVYIKDANDDVVCMDYSFTVDEPMLS